MTKKIQSFERFKNFPVFRPELHRQFKKTETRENLENINEWDAVVLITIDRAGAKFPKK